MMEPGFDLALHDALERALGFAVKPLERLDGEINLNFRAVRATDGLTFAVKCSPQAKHEAFGILCGHLKALEGTKAARRLFPDALQEFRGYDVLCLSWCDGERLFPDRLTDEQMAALADDYLDFSRALQRTVPSCPPDDCAAMRRLTLGRCRGFWSRGIRRLLERELTEDGVRLRPEKTRLIHGDLHHGNFLFKDGRVSGFFDFENVTHGYPAEDLIRYFVCASEHLRWYEQHRKLRILDLFRIAVARLPYPADEWATALNRLLVLKIARKAADRGLGFLMSVNLLFRARYYHTLKRVAAETRAKLGADLV